MNPRRVRFTVTARDQVRSEQAWWRKNRVHTEIFATELAETVRIVAVLPGIGSSYRLDDVPGLRRIYLRKVACHLYYTFDDRDVIVRAVWGAHRSRGPFVEP